MPHWMPQRTLFLEIGEEEYQQWRHNPITSAYLRFVADQRDNFRKAALELWEEGRLQSVGGDELRGRVKTLDELHELSLDAIQAFYKQEADSETETDQEHTG